MTAPIEPSIPGRRVICLTKNKKYLVIEDSDYYKKIEDALIGQPVDFYPLFFCGKNEFGFKTYIIKYIDQNKIKYQLCRATRIESAKKWFATNNPHITERWITDLTPHFSAVV